MLAEVEIFTSLLGTASALGLEPSLIQSDKPDAADYSTVVWASTGLAALLLVTAFLMGPFAEWVFDNDELGRVLPVLAVSTAVTNLGIAPRADLRRNLDFRTLAIASFVGTMVGGAVAITSALLGAGIWALVAEPVVSAIVAVGWIWVVSDVQFTRGFSWHRLRRLARFGGPYTGEQFFNFVNRRADDFIIGVVLGDTALGFYRVAYTALQAITGVLGGSLNAVALPLFSRSASEPDRLQSQFLRATEFTALVVLPICAGFAVVADLAIPILYGSGWARAIRPAQVLSFVTLAHSLLLFSPTAMYAQGRSDIQFKLTGLYAVLNTIGFLIGVRWGIVGVAAAYALQNLLTAPVELAVLRRLIYFTFSSYLRTLWRPVVATLVMVAAIVGLRYFLTVSANLELILAVIIGSLIYGVGLMATGPSYILGLIRPVVSSFKV